MGRKKQWRKTVFGLRPSVSFCSASAKNFHFGASLLYIYPTVKYCDVSIHFFDDSQILSEVSFNQRIFFHTSGIIKQLEGGPLIRWPPCLLT